MPATNSLPFRPLAPGIGEAVARRTILRTNKEGVLETWGDVAKRVAEGNSSLLKKLPLDSIFDKASEDSSFNPFLELDMEIDAEKRLLQKHIANASLLMSGRHLQHGDRTQKDRNMEVFTNCSTSSSSFLLFYLLMNGSGVGRAYDNDLMLVDWSKNMPFIRVVLSADHKDFNYETMETPESARKKYKLADWFEVPDTREGWARAVEIIENAAYKGGSRYSVVLDFSEVRPSGSPIKGMQNRPASGPVPLMRAFQNMATLRHSILKPWESTMWVDHYLSECVLVGGARRSARIATKIWSDKGIRDFVSVKKGGFLWSANNSVAVDEEFWKQDTDKKRDIFEAICHASYFDKTGEPGFINQHKLVQNDIGLEDYSDGKYAESIKYKPFAIEYLADLAKVVAKKKYTQITNPCGEITLSMLGGYCVIADVVPYYTNSDDEAEEVFRAATRALIRTNTMDSLYSKETARTNRIGVGMTGLHEYAWRRFGYGFRDLLDEEKSRNFWLMLSRFKKAIVEEAETYSKILGLNIPHTNTTIKPAGTTSKLFALSEGAHLPAMKEYLRWVQFRNDDPLIKEYAEKGYPTKKLRTYVGSTVVGFPTQPEICRLGMGDKLVTAGEATPTEQYQWLKLLEKYWIRGVRSFLLDEDNDLMGYCYSPLEDTGNQISYTLKYKPDVVDYQSFKKTILENQPQIRCASVMPQIDGTAYEYQPEEPISRKEYIRLYKKVNGGRMQEDIDLEQLKCDSGACPI